ncbi:MAG: porin family protein, partial [Bacteroidetes bacterium]|nr:porin family protein [Bacteroidota bacterium]
SSNITDEPNRLHSSLQDMSIQAGLSFSTTSSDETDYQTGSILKASVLLPITTRLSTRVGLGWVQKGESLEALGIKVGFTANYLSIPALLSINPTSSLRLMAGPVLSFSIGCSASASVEDIDINLDCDEFEDASDLVNPVDLSVMAGIGVDIPVSRTISLSVDAAYDFGLTEAYSDETQNRSFLLAAGVRFPLGR